jgi:DMSO/TMAO reductase YedYZ molybdopterin-dependent catalytic subunit
MITRLVTRELPAPPGWLRHGPLRAGAFPSDVRASAFTARIGSWFGSVLVVAFVTGLASHLAQHPIWGLSYPTRPVALYRVTEGIHVASGLACIPLLFVKLWSVYPRLWQWPPARTLAHAAERLSLLVLVGATAFQLLTGLTNIFYWYAWPFFFTDTHYWTAWVVAGSVLLHVSIKWTIIRQSRTVSVTIADPAPERSAGLSRRGVLFAVGGAVATVAAVTVGETVTPLRGIDLLGPRRPGSGPEHVPINKTARDAGVIARARAADFRLRVTGNVDTPLSLSVADLLAMPQHEARLPIACVEGWSASGRWTGVPIRDLLLAAGARPVSHVQVSSLELFGRYHVSVLDKAAADDPSALLALRLNGVTLDLDHGYPCRLIAPDRPGVLNTKWVQQLVVQ